MAILFYRRLDIVFPRYFILQIANIQHQRFLSSPRCKQMHARRREYGALTPHAAKVHRCAAATLMRHMPPQQVELALRRGKSAAIGLATCAIYIAASAHGGATISQLGCKYRGDITRHIF